MKSANSMDFVVYIAFYIGLTINLQDCITKYSCKNNFPVFYSFRVWVGVKKTELVFTRLSVPAFWGMQADSS